MPERIRLDEEGLRIASIDLIDWQQRLTTIALLLIALREALRAGDAEDVALAERIDDRWLKAADGKAKLALSEADAPTLEALVEGEGRSALPDEPSRFLMDNHERFVARLRSEGLDREALLRSLNESCLAFAAEPGAPGNRAHLDRASGKPTGPLSQRKLFGDQRPALR